MASPRFRLSICPANQIASYIRHARTETLKAVGAKPDPAYTGPFPGAVYVIAYDERGDAPVALAEAGLVSNVYQSYEDIPYSGVGDLRSVCRFDRLASVRTIYVEPAYRAHHALYAKLLVDQCRHFASLGAEWAVAVTDSQNDTLHKLYTRSRGRRLGTFHHEGMTTPRALYLFSLGEILRQPFARRQTRELD